jgi:hypothetical protein
VVDDPDPDAFNDAVASLDHALDSASTDAVAVEPGEPASFAAHAATFHEAPVVPELSALEIMPLEGIRDKKVKEIALEVRYEDMTEERVRRIRQIVEENPGEIPLTVNLVDVPPALGGPEVRLRLNHHFRVQPGPALQTALGEVHAKAQYLFERNSNAA